MLTKRLPARFFRNDKGHEPVREWLRELSKSDRTKIGEDIKKVEFGWPVGMPTCRPLGNGLFEVRTHLRNNRISRVLFCIYDETIVLLHAFIKKTEETPQSELTIAEDRKKTLSDRDA